MVFRLCRVVCLLLSAGLFGWMLAGGSELFSVWVPGHLRPLQPTLWNVRPEIKPALENGDRVLAVNGRPLERPEDWYNAFQNTATGQSVTVTLLRNSAERTASIRVGGDPAAFTPILATVMVALLHLLLYQAEGSRDLLRLVFGLGLMTALPDLDHRPITGLPWALCVSRILFPWSVVLALHPDSRVWNRVGLTASLLLALGSAPVWLFGYGCVPSAWASTADEAFRWGKAFSFVLFWLASIATWFHERPSQPSLSPCE